MNITYAEQRVRTNTNAQRVRELLHELHDDIAKQTARKLPPIRGVNSWQQCACGAQTRVVKRVDDGSEVPLCGACVVHELDGSAAQQA